jgi:6,7-dimethyl-8-ribityllumazine synthase
MRTDVQRTSEGATAPGMARKVPGAHILIIEARFYEKIADDLAAGAMAAIEAAGATWERVSVPGALEIPQALRLAVEAERIATPVRKTACHGAVVLGCVIRGETSHFDIVCNNANHWTMQVAIEHGLAVGNGILTVENEDQALARTAGGIANKGGDAARAALALIAFARTGAVGHGA